ncbi:uncharacterized protein [Physcomitrium patens]|uniref:RING-type domain-containing protein n=1 Tax=Physcomitrium patens TaxID=3218 RepID=A0A7I4F8I2_PHYPA|nr:uncharacterized protein LOC112294677 isoform X1 [Physcomitrium patens]|eukprot:XP_024401169.1 uncharacterized protein LOC112294677 isoform X1 [Physcomitrella patens]
MAFISTKIAIGIGVGIVSLLALCYFVYWGVRKFRHRTRSTGQISATPEEIPSGTRNGLKKEMVIALPIVKASDVNVDEGLKSHLDCRCSICWQDFRNEATMRQLPHCKHVFHRHCIDPVLDEQITCPACGVILTGSFGTSKRFSERNPSYQRDSSRSMCSNDPSASSTPKSPAMPPYWVHINRPVPLPQTAVVTSRSSSSERFEIDLNASGQSPLLKYMTGSHVEDIDLEQCIDISFTFDTDIPVERRPPSTNERSVDSFSFGVPSADTFTFPGPSGAGQDSWDAAPAIPFKPPCSSRESTTTDACDTNSGKTYSQSTSRRSRLSNSFSASCSFNRLGTEDRHAHSELQDEHVHFAADHQTSTGPQDQCSLDASGNLTLSFSSSEASKKPSRVVSNCNTYSLQVESSQSTRWERL